MTNLEWLVLRYQREELDLEGFLTQLHWYCPPTYYPYPYMGDAVEHWHKL